MSNCYISETEKVDYIAHGRKVFINYMTLEVFKGFDNMNSLDAFAKKLGFQYELCNIINSDLCGEIRHYSMSHNIIDRGIYFNSIADLPEGAEKVILFDNGEPVWCYFINDGTNIYIFRPNPNVKELRKHPLSKR